MDGENHIRVGKLNLVDLAGSERQAKTGAAVSGLVGFFVLAYFEKFLEFYPCEKRGCFIILGFSHFSIWGLCIILGNYSLHWELFIIFRDYSTVKSLHFLPPGWTFEGSYKDQPVAVGPGQCDLSSGWREEFSHTLPWLETHQAFARFVEQNKNKEKEYHSVQIGRETRYFPRQKTGC